MRRVCLLSAALALLAATPASAQSRDGLFVDVKPRSWLDAGREVRIGEGRDYVTSSTFGGGPVNGISSRGSENLPTRGLGAPLVRFNFLGAYLNR
jgi:hypothetical protein